MMASARPGERATSFVVACSLLSRFVRQNDVAPSQLGLGIKGELRNQAAAPARPALLSVEIGILLGARGWGSVQFRFLWGTVRSGARSGRALCYIRFGNDVFGLRIRTPLSVSLSLFSFSGEVEQQRTPATINLLPGADGEETERRKETMELFPQSAGFGVKDPTAAPRCVLLLHIM
jgi:hypothetical protein